MPCGQQGRVRQTQRFAFFAEEVERDHGIELRIVHLAADESAVLVVLHEAVVGIAGERQRAQHERVERWESKQAEPGRGRL